MSDTKLRELERRWMDSRSPADEAAYLLERVRVGDLTQERLELVRFLRWSNFSLVDHDDRTLHPVAVPARRLQNNRALLLLDDAVVTRLVRVVLDCGQDCWVRTGLALARRALEVWLDAVTDEVEPDRYAPGRLLAAVRERALNGTSERFDQEVVATDGVGDRMRYRWGPTEVLVPTGAVTAAQHVSQLASIVEPGPDRGAGSARVLLGNLVYDVALALSLRLGVDRQRGGAQLRSVSDRAAGINRVIYVLAEELVPWALGDGDPIAAPDYLARLNDAPGPRP